MSILVLDLGGQTCHLISRLLDDLRYPVEIRSSVTLDEAKQYQGIILSGGPQSVYAQGSSTIDPGLLDLNIPMLGICYGHQLLAHMLGGTVAKGKPEYGDTTINIHDEDFILDGTPAEQIVWMSHGDAVVMMPDDVVVTSTSKGCSVVSFYHKVKPVYGVQFHPEVVHTLHGRQMIQNFAEICGVEQISWGDRITTIVEEIKQTVGVRMVLFFVSGGVDSTVAFALCAKALAPEKLVGVFVDTGLMRQHETHDIRDCFDRLGFADRLRIVDEAERFLEALKDVYDPEQKREIIGRLFVEVQTKIIASLEGEWLLGQGTIYPDTIESGSGSAAKIKTHHNRCAEIQEMITQGRLVEPLRNFYKDQVREIGESLGIASHFVSRWPFPGPGLAIRCLCVDSPDYAEPVDAWDQYDGLSGLYDLVRVPLRSVGVQGDARTYRTTLAVKGPLNKYDLTALARQFPEDRIIVHLGGKLDLTRGQIKPASLTQRRIATLRQADHVVRSAMIGLEHLVWQFPVILIPLSFGSGESIVLRPVASRDGMTADFVVLPNSVLDRITKGIGEISGIDAVFLDVSDKPPATIEWE